MCCNLFKETKRAGSRQVPKELSDDAQPNRLCHICCPLLPVSAKQSWRSKESRNRNCDVHVWNVWQFDPGAFIKGNSISTTNGTDLSSTVNQLQFGVSSTLLTDPSLIVNVKNVTQANISPTQISTHSQQKVSAWRSTTDLVPTGIDNGGPVRRIQLIPNNI